MDNNFNQPTDQQQSTPNYSQGNQQSAVYQQTPTYQQPNMYQSTDLEEPVSVGHWLVCMLVAMIPCVGFIMMLVWAFSSGEKKSKSNFYKATLIMSVIWIVLLIIFIIITSVSTASLMYGFY